MEDLFKLSKQYMQFLDRSYKRRFLTTDPFKNKLTILLGQRGIGKSTLIVQYLKSQLGKEDSEESVLYFPADHFIRRTRALYEIAEQFNNLGGKIICFDEIHKYSNWSQELKSIYDTFPKLKVIASGSSILEVDKGSHDLSRRSIVRYLNGLSLREYIEIETGHSFPVYTLDDILKNHESIARDITSLLEKNHTASILVFFRKYLRKGYYPYYNVYADEAEFYSTLERNQHITIESDIPAIYPLINGATVKKMEQLISLIAQQVPFKPTLSHLTNALDISDQRILKTFFKYLEDAGIINTVCKEGNRIAVLEKPEKIFLNNTNQMHIYGEDKISKGTIRETFFVNIMSALFDVIYSEQGDFVIEDNTFEIGGNGKTFDQIKNVPNSFLVVDDVQVGIRKRIPLWLFGFLY